MTITELWRHYDNMMDGAAHLEHLLNEMESERQDLLEEAEATLKAIKDIQGSVEGVEIASAELAIAQDVSFG